MEYNKKFDISIIPTFVMLIIFGVGVWIGAQKINKIAVENSLNVLQNSASQFATEIERAVISDGNNLEMIANVLTEYQDVASEDVKDMMLRVSRKAAFSQLRITTPDDRVFVFENGTYREETATLDFDKEVEKGNYVSNILLAESGAGYLYQAVPIEKNGKAIGFLYGITALADLPDRFFSEAFDGNAQIFVLDGRSGDFIFSSWDGKQNLYDVTEDDVSVRKNDDYKAWIQNLKAGKKDCIAFLSDNNKEYYYTVAVPLNVNEWRVLISVPESSVFKRIKGIDCIFRDLVILSGILLVLYLTWVVILVRKEIERNNRQMKDLAYMYDVQKSLFDSSRGKDNIIDGLQKAGNMLTASLTFVSSFENGEITEIFQWAAKDIKITVENYEASLRKLYGKLGGHIQDGKSILCNIKDRTSELQEWNFEEMQKVGVSNFMIVPIFDSEGHLTGALGAFNTKKHWHEATLLECISWDFMLALSNIKYYHIIRRMGTIDAITELKNRNSYEQQLKQYAVENLETLACVYMDANGLHELNNTQGHSAGDEMLRSIASNMIKWFGRERSYRIGGDEFVIFCRDLLENEILDRVANIKEALTAGNYFVSVGIAIGKADSTIEQLISEAEKKMYEAKKQYYKENAQADRRCR